MTLKIFHLATMTAAILAMAGCASNTSTSSADAWPALTVPIEQVRPVEPMRLAVNYKVMEGVPRGVTILRIHVDEHGQTRNVGLLQASGHPNLDEAAMKSAWGAVYQPYIKDGQPVPVTVVVPMALR